VLNTGSLISVTLSHGKFLMTAQLKVFRKALFKAMSSDHNVRLWSTFHTAVTLKANSVTEMNEANEAYCHHLVSTPYTLAYNRPNRAVFHTAYGHWVAVINVPLQ